MRKSGRKKEYREKSGDEEKNNGERECKRKKQNYLQRNLGRRRGRGKRELW